MKKSSVDEIRARFDKDVERFSNLETGQEAAVDAALALELVTQAAARATPQATEILDVGCGAGNYTLKLLQRLPHVNVTLVDLSRPMLERAVARITPVAAGAVRTHQGDIREFPLETDAYDIVLAASVLHHLRSDEEWRSVFEAFHRALRPGGSLWIFDMVASAHPAVAELMRERYSQYLVELRDEAYRDQVFAYIEQEDTPRPLVEQLELLRSVGFSRIDVLHKQTCFAAFGAVKD